MGGCEINLADAKITKEATIDVLAFWGGIDIRVPRAGKSRTTSRQSSPASSIRPTTTFRPARLASSFAAARSWAASK